MEPGPANADTISLKLEDAADVATMPNLLKGRVGETIAVAIPHAAVASAGLTEGSLLKARIRLAGPMQAFVHPDHLQRIS